MSTFSQANDPYDGFGMSSHQEVADLNKALEIGYEVDPSQLTSGFPPLRVESVDGTLKVVTYTERHISFWKKIPKSSARSTVEQYVQLRNYGQGRTGFLPEGTAPEEDDLDFFRKFERVKYLGRQQKVTHPATLVQTYIMDAIAAQNMAGAMWMVRQLEWALFFGNANLGVGGSDWVEFSGLYNMVDNNWDMAGQPLTEAGLNDVSQVVLDNFGVPTDLFLPYQVYADINKQFLPKERVVMPTASNGYQAGVLLNTMVTQAGPVDLNPTFFLGAGDRRSPLTVAPSAATSSKAPTAPASVDVAAIADGQGDWAKSGALVGGGNLTYRVTACNRHGESASVESAGLDIVANDRSARLTVNNAAQVAVQADYFNIYRQDFGTGSFYWIASVPVADGQQGNNGTTQLFDRNAQMPGTYTAFLGEMSNQVLEFKQLTPLIKMDLAVIEPSIRWMLLLYGVLMLYAPLKWVKISNIGVAG